MMLEMCGAMRTRLDASKRRWRSASLKRARAQRWRNCASAGCHRSAVDYTSTFAASTRGKRLTASIGCVTPAQGDFDEPRRCMPTSEWSRFLSHAQIEKEAAASLSRAQTRAAARRSPGRQDQARRSPPACGRARTPADWRAGCRATLDTHPGGRAGCAPHPASAAVGSCAVAACGNAPAAAPPCGAVDSAVVVPRYSEP